MTRHINLMTPDMRPGQGRVQLPLFTAVLALTLVAGFVYLGVHAVIGLTIERRIDSAQQRVDASALELHRLRQNYPSIASEADLRANNETLQTRLTARREELHGLTNQIDTVASGFARPLASLSDHDLDGLWLTRIELRDSHSHLELEGMARQPNLIPRYLGQLESSVFQGLSIRNLSIEQSGTNLWRFTMAETLDTPKGLEELLP
ncbi:PilN domain-containing protein [Saccharospirillum mangrovi]|uniref:PilN domain-containing protein n=1 Tax=Saccharospirillum mangrovi TaxID=2161747 RepID=UPI000D39ACBA|nr:PilN domain-containing protein [Saccharospirillum mangrovi]